MWSGGRRAFLDEVTGASGGSRHGATVLRCMLNSLITDASTVTLKRKGGADFLKEKHPYKRDHHQKRLGTFERVPLVRLHASLISV